MSALADRYGRVATDLRVSLTDRCNLRCSYCMPAEGLDWLPDDERAHRRRGRPAGRHRGVERLGVREVRFTGGEPLVRRGLVDIVAPHRDARPAPRDLADHQRARPGPHRAGARRRRARPGQRQPRHGPAGHVPRRSPAATGSHDVRRRARRGPATPGSARSRSTPCCCAASTTTRRPSCCAGASTEGYELRFIEQMPLDAQHGWSRDGDGHRRRDLRPPRPRVRAHPGGRAAGERPGRAVRRRRRPGHGRRDRLGHPAVLRRLRPGPAHRRRPGPQLPVRPRGVRPARRAARRRLRRGARRALGRSRCAASCPATASTTRRSSSPTGRCRRSAAELRRSLRSSALERHDVAQEAARAEEVDERLPVLVARQPGLAAVRGVQLRVVPEQRPGGGRRAALGGAVQRPPRRSARRRHGGTRRGLGDRHGNQGCRTTTGEAVRHRGELDGGD